MFNIMGLIIWLFNGPKSFVLVVPHGIRFPTDLWVEIFLYPSNQRNG